MTTMTKLTIDDVATIMPNAKANGLDNEWQYFLKTCHDYEINTKNRLAAFLMNVAKESGELYYVEEIDDGWYLEDREDLGNIYQGDGPRFKGHGYIQTTGRNNHREVGEALGIDAEGDPTLLTKMPYPWYSAGWYWRYGSSWGNLNGYADEGDYRKTILGVRGGPDPDREHYWWTAMEVLPDDLIVPEPDDAENAAPISTAPSVSTEGDIDGYPTQRAALDKDGWLITADRTKYIALPEAPDAKFESEGVWIKKSGVYVPQDKEVVTVPDSPPPSTWSWWERDGGQPLEPYAIGDDSYIDWHPTRYDDVWREDVERLCRYLVDEFGVWCNTYVGHPPPEMVQGVYYDAVSFDIWGSGYRGDPSYPERVDEAYWWFFNSGKEWPSIRWCIRKGEWWVDDGYDWRPYPEDDPWSDAGHYNHAHVTVY
jgi:predicted chitinase